MNRDSIRTLMMIWSCLCVAFVLLSVVSGAVTDPGAGVCCGVAAMVPALSAWVVGMIVLGLSMLMFKEGPAAPPEPPTNATSAEPPPMPPAAGEQQELPPMSAEAIGVAIVGFLVFGFLAYQLYVNWFLVRR